ncbi:MAG TPA: inositol monophosphatase family protein [Ignavibacteriaceae bacterium]|nr:inositol monophosphatase family protein [Ignavibacteriaceae bacterium]
MINDLIEISKEAGEIVREGYRQNFKVEFKTGENNLVTEIDKKSEQTIIEFIQKKYPSHAILAEERGELKNDSEYLWVIDPLDGTTNFAHGLPIFSVSIGLQKNGNTIAGVVYDVMRNIIYSAEENAGAFANDRRINASQRESISQSVLVTGFPYNVKENPEKAFERFEVMTRNSRAVRRLGSAAIDFCYVAEGVFEGFWEVHLQPWDICAGKLLVEEAGGLVTDFNGSRINIFSKRILASNTLVHSQMIELLSIG